MESLDDWNLIVVMSKIREACLSIHDHRSAETAQVLIHSTYLGWYDTDHALPSIYFRPDFERPSDAAQLELELTYLFDEDDIDYFRTGPGVRTR